MKKRKISVFMLLICLCMLFAAVPANAKTTSLTLNLKAKPGTRVYYVVRGKQLKLKGKYGGKTYAGKSLKFTSSDKKVATVSKAGKVKTKKAGRTIITVSSKDGKYSAFFRLTVKKKSLSVAERAANYKSRTKYKILVNRGAHKVYIFHYNGTKWVRVKTFSCVVGAPGTPTPTGSYTLKDRGYAFKTESGNYCWYFTRIVNDVCFHSVIYAPDPTPQRVVDNSMGVSVSHGCIRLYLQNAKWIKDNCPIGTRVVIYN